MTTDLDTELQRVARALVADPPPVPDWPLDDFVAAPEDDERRWHLVGAAAVAVLAIGAAGFWLAVDSRTDPSSTDRIDVPATQPQLDPSADVEIERFIVDGMNVDVAEETADGESSLWQTTPDVETPHALPGMNINTGSGSGPDLTAWQRVGESAEVLGQTVELYTLNGDPLAVTLTTPIGTVITIVGEGVDVEEFKNLLTRVRPLDANEWADLVDAHPFPPASDPTDASSEPTSFPVLDDLPAGLSATVHVQQIADGVTTPGTEALIGRRVDGVLTDTVNIHVQATSFSTSPAVGHPATDAVVMGEPARVLDRTSIPGDHVNVIWGSGPYFLASGADPLAFLSQTAPGAIRAEAASDADQPPQLSIGSLPDGFELIAGPQTFGQATLNATLSIGADNYDVSVSTRNPVMQMALFGPLRAIEVTGRPAWTFLSSFPTQDITWQVDDSTYAYLKINDGTDAGAALDLADRITFVDFDTWTARYPPDTITVSATTAPAED